jgi:hypothetical protein
MMYCVFLGASKLSDREDLPIVGDEFDEDDAPFVHGSTDVRQVRFFWNKPSKDPRNHKAITTIASFAKSHGRDYVPEAGEFLDVIAHGDLLARFVTKYQALQKVYRGTTGKKSTKPGELTKNKRDNRARGVGPLCLKW